MSRRGESGRGGFGRASMSAAVRSAGPDVSLGTASKIVRAADEAETRLKAHVEKHRPQWTTQRFGDLLAKEAPTPRLTLAGVADDPKARIAAKASALVDAKQAHRLGQIERARTTMLQTGRVRETRKVHWNKGLGE